MEKTYFKLFANCLPVKGRKIALIYDFQKFRFYKISNELAELIPLLHNIEIEQILHNNKDLYSTLNFFIDEEVGFLTSNPEKFPDLSEEWQTPSTIENAVIEFGFESNHNLLNIFSKLSELKCNAVVFKFQYKSSYKLLIEILESSIKFEFSFVEIWLIENIKNYELKKIIKDYKMVRKLKIFNSKYNDKKLIKQSEIDYYTFNTFQDFCKNEQPGYNLNYTFYCESRKFNNCLNKKVSIDYEGNIKNCLYMDRCYGNINEDDLTTIVKSNNFQEIWKITKDNIEDCNQCEYRYACFDCRAFTVKGNLTSKQVSCNLIP